MRRGKAGSFCLCIVFSQAPQSKGYGCLLDLPKLDIEAISVMVKGADCDGVVCDIRNLHHREFLKVARHGVRVPREVYEYQRTVSKPEERQGHCT